VKVYVQRVRTPDTVQQQQQTVNDELKRLEELSRIYEISESFPPLGNDEFHPGNWHTFLADQ
jgi:hypothetical protein